MSVFGFEFGFNKEKSRASAEKYLQQNKLPNAIAEYEKILKVEPNDFTILNTVGDIYARLGQNDKAIERFRVVAESYVNDGSTLKAIALYKKITKLDPNSLPTMEKLAELYRKQGLVADARSMLLQTAEAFTRRGQSKETLRLLKELVLFDPENIQVISRTADLMIQGGQKNDARDMLSQTASTLIERHSLEPAQKILDKLIALDRSNLRAQELRAQVTLELGDAEKAAELYEAIPDLDSRVDGLRHLLTAWLKLDNLDNAFPIARKLVSVHHDADGMLQVAGAYYKENNVLRVLAIYSEFASELIAHDKEDVLSHLHGAVSRVRTDPDALQTIYDLFQRAGENSMLAEILELLAHACVQSEQFERARDAYKELITLEPDSSAHVQAYRQVCARLSPNSPAPPVSQPPAMEDKPLSLEEFRTGSEPDLPSQVYPPQVEELIAAALSEAELYESFASKTRGIAVLETALHSAPEDLRLNRTLGMLYRQENDASNSARCYKIMQRVLENMGAAEAADYYAGLTTSGQTTTWEAKGSEFTASDFDIAADDSNGGTEEIDLSSEWESVWQNDPVAEAPMSPEPPTPEPVVHLADDVAGYAAENAAESDVADVAADPKVAELLEEVHFCLTQQIWEEAESAVSRLAEVCPNHPELPELRDQVRRASSLSGPAVAAPQPGFAPVEVIEVSTDSTPLPVLSPSADDAPYAGNVPPADHVPPVAEPSLGALASELDLELGDSFTPVAQPRRVPPPPVAPTPEPAPAPVLSELAPLEPLFPEPPFPLLELEPAFDLPEPIESDPLLLEPPLPPPPVQVAPPPPRAPAPTLAPPPAQPYMAASVEPQSEPSPSVFGDLLQDFERDLDMAPQQDDDPETHFNLGIAFREMGLLDEAIGELQKVCHLAGNGLTRERTQQAYIWLATCFVEKSVPEASFKWFLRALDTAPDEESRTAVNYELASAYEAAGRKREALDHFLEVYGSNIDYRDVATRIRELRSTT
jgi:tetratricopeptide (TPR) repeat protein